MCYRFLVLWQGQSTNISFRFLWFSFCGRPGHQCPFFDRFSCFWRSQCLVVWPRLDDPFISQNPWEFCISFSKTLYSLYYLEARLNFSFLHNSLWLPSPPNRVLSSSRLLPSLIMRFIISSLSSYNLHLLFWWFLSIFALA